MQTRGLWTIGAGVETAIYRNWTAKVEYLHLETGTTTANFNIMGVPSSVSTRLNEKTVRVGVNYRFLRPALPGGGAGMTCSLRTSAFAFCSQGDRP
jgi:hypothetical protein